MRIISGKYRGKRLTPPRGDRVRPTTDMVKENVFNLIAPYVADSSFLDLFAGSGAIGIEAISRGAERVVFADKDRESIECVRRNLASVSEKAETITADYLTAAARLKGNKFDLIYIDAPYDMHILDDALKAIVGNGILSEGGLVIYESLSETNRKSGLKDWELYKTRRYGSVTIDVYRRIPNAPIDSEARQ